MKYTSITPRSRSGLKIDGPISWLNLRTMQVQDGVRLQDTSLMLNFASEAPIPGISRPVGEYGGE